ncbi:unnamed protein product [Calypogeia fissa]
MEMWTPQWAALSRPIGSHHHHHMARLDSSGTGRHTHKAERQAGPAPGNTLSPPSASPQPRRKFLTGEVRYGTAVDSMPAHCPVPTVGQAGRITRATPQAQDRRGPGPKRAKSPAPKSYTGRKSAHRVVAGGRAGVSPGGVEGGAGEGEANKRPAQFARHDRIG